MSNKMRTVSNFGTSAQRDEQAPPAYYLNLQLKGARDERSFKLYADNPRHALPIQFIEEHGGAQLKGDMTPDQRDVLLSMLEDMFTITCRPGARAEPDAAPAIAATSTLDARRAARDAAAS